ncbi:anti-CBASS protein Acb1 family protein, partial [Glaesserella parasuis]
DTPLVLRPGTVRQGSFEAVRVVEPYWVTPNNYNSIDPTAADFYKPSTWWMLGTEVHASRLQTMISRPVPDMLKPTYSFRGISLTQLAMPYVDNWLRTQQSVSDTVKQFSITGVKTDLQQYLQPGGAT